MVFNTPEFFAFLAVVLALYYVLPLRGQNRMLLAASYIFYGWWDWRFCSLLLISTAVDYACGLAMQDRPRRRYLALSIATNLGILGFFKYFNFFADSAVRLLDLAGLHASPVTLQIILPVGISFYTFQTMSYTIDVYRRQMTPCRSPVDFALYVSFFPQLVAGPIERAGHLLPQIQTARRLTVRHVQEGVYLILAGLVKKVAIADLVASSIEPMLQRPEVHGSNQLALAISLFSLRIYGDFCGYSDIARGTARLLGFDLMQNFRYPFFAHGVTELWRRWHVSLSFWLRDYVYIPLGGSRGGPWRAARSTLITMGLAGLWHGAGWNFVLWGLIQGIYLVIGRLFRDVLAEPLEGATRKGIRPLVLIPMIAANFALFTFALIFFVIRDFPTAFRFVEGLFQMTYHPDPVLTRLFLYASAVILLIDIPESRAGTQGWLRRMPPVVQGLYLGGLALLVMVTWTDNYEPFIYFQF